MQLAPPVDASTSESNKIEWKASLLSITVVQCLQWVGVGNSNLKLLGRIIMDPCWPRRFSYNPCGEIEIAVQGQVHPLSRRHGAFTALAGR